ncbi:unnamed protein product [Caenorhabditis bovis]|uniref:DOMON domain-containing protein n=1 Tax=Caenorhabditis bovis TaxID=2654633 RepID=A0A8S1F4E1_9PELO|nr:unnamed protein product [Caenorhabditis bovis]
MVVTISLLTQRDARLAVIWRLAICSRKSRIGGVSKQEIRRQSVRDACTLIGRLIEGHGSVSEKCSLYIIAQLMFGTTILFSRQVEILRNDAVEAVELLKNKFRSELNEMNIENPKITKSDRKKMIVLNDTERPPHKRPRKSPATELDTSLDITLDPKLLLPVADKHAITLRDELPSAWPSNYVDEDDLEPLEADDLHQFYDAYGERTFLEFQSSSSAKRQTDDIRNAESFASPPPPHTDELRPFEFRNPEERTPERTPSKRKSPFEPAPGLEDVLNMPLFSFGDRHSSIELDEELDNLRTSSADSQTEKFVAPQSSEGLILESIDEVEIRNLSIMKTPIRRRQLNNRGVTQIRHDQMREMQNDYSSLKHDSARRLMIDETEIAHLTLNQLLDPVPHVQISRRFPRELVSLYERNRRGEKYNKDVGTMVSDLNSTMDSEEGLTNVTGLSELDLENLRFGETPLKEQEIRVRSPSPKRIEEVVREGNSQNDVSKISAVFDNVSLSRFSNENSQKSTTTIGPFATDQRCTVDVSKHEIRQRVLRACQISAPFPGKFEEMLNPNEGKRVAARAFYTLLEMMKERVVKVKPQEKPYGAIEILLESPEGSLDLDEPEMNEMSLVLAAIFAVLAASEAAKCSVKNGDMSARWQVVDGELTMEVTTKNMGNNQWSAVGFGPDMSDLEVIVFRVIDNSPSVRTGTTSGYGAPQFDATLGLSLESVDYNSNTFVARFSRPLGSLSGCKTWNFVTDGTIEDGEIGYHNSPPHSFFGAQDLTNNGEVISMGSPQIRVTNVCPAECTQIFMTRTSIVDPVPIAAVYNNRISTRFDALFDSN